jgi:hypothetical protein
MLISFIAPMSNLIVNNEFTAILSYHFEFSNYNNVEKLPSNKSAKTVFEGRIVSFLQKYRQQKPDRLRSIIHHYK